MKDVAVVLLVFGLYGCASTSSEYVANVADTKSQCIGSTDLPMNFANKFEKVDDAALLNETLGQPNKGKLCQGQVYQSQSDVEITLYRAWNSTNPHSKLGRWWAFDKPVGSVSDYRADYEICYQWSPLDKLVSCSLRAGEKVVVGTGQSAQCSDYLTYLTSETQQIYLADAANSLSNCVVLEGHFSWK